MSKRIPTLSAKFSCIHFVDENYHQQHPQFLHQHDDVLELFYVMQGNGLYNVAGQKYILRPGSVVICNANTLHGEEPFSAKNMQSYCCVLKELEVHKLPPNTLIGQSVCPVLEFHGQKKESIDHLIMAIYLMEKQRDLLICEILANGFLNLIHMEIKSNLGTPKRKYTEEAILQIIDYLDQHYTEPVSLQMLGEKFHMSHYYLAHIFKAHTGMSPMHYIQNRKIGQAQNLLMNTNMPMNEISEVLGFSDNCHFSATFKKYIGITPTQYRQHFRLNELPSSDSSKGEHR